MQQQLHENPDYGVASVHYAPLVAQVIEGVGAQEMLNYGAAGFDPALGQRLGGFLGYRGVAVADGCRDFD
jgi:hypothetical protein